MLMVCVFNLISINIPKYLLGWSMNRRFYFYLKMVLNAFFGKYTQLSVRNLNENLFI